MPDFEKIRLRTPFEARFHYRGFERRHFVDDEFEVVVPSLSRAAVTQVATVFLPIGTFDLVSIDGRLYRPYIDKKDETWTAKRFGDEPPPAVRLGQRWTIGDNERRKTTLLGSPWRPWIGEVSKTMRQAARRSAPESRHEVEMQIRAIAASDLRFVDGMLFQQTRSPAWFVGMGADRARPDFPDRTAEPGMVLLDARTMPKDVGAIARRCGSRLDRFGGLFEVFEPSLLPDTVEADALASFSLWLAKRFLLTYRMTESNSADTRALLDMMETAPPDAMPLSDCYRLIECIRNGPPDSPDRGRRIDPEDIAAVKRAASLVLGIVRRRPAPQPDEIDPEDVDAIAATFRY